MSYLEQRRNQKLNGKIDKPKKTYQIPKKSAKKIAEEKKDKVPGEMTELQKWYEGIMKKEDKQCWNCGQDLTNYSKEDWHACIAHIVPKSTFPSVATHPLNYMILGKWCNCHGTYDSNWDSAQKMPIFKEAIDRFIMISPDIQETHKLPNIFQQILDDRDPFKNFPTNDNIR